MFRIFLAFMLLVLTLCVPPLAFITVPLAVIYVIRLAERAKHLNRCAEVYREHLAEVDRQKLLRRL
jgi:hypothetical protein